MILTTVNFFSDVLGLRSQLNVILPQRSLTDAQSKSKPKYRSLYLLHGLTDDHTAWQRWTSIERYVEKMDLAVIMPAVHRSFYTDMAQGSKYWTFISEEVPAIARDLFPLSARRADNFVAGLSMGGYGAFKLALRCPDRFAAAASLSGALDMAASTGGEDPGWLAEMRNIFGDPNAFQGSPNDLFFLAEKVARAGVKPKLFQYCGTDDFLYAENVRFRDFIQPLGFDYVYEESPGDHSWGYWDMMIQKVLAWLPLK